MHMHITCTGHTNLLSFSYTLAQDSTSHTKVSIRTIKYDLRFQYNTNTYNTPILLKSPPRFAPTYNTLNLGHELIRPKCNSGVDLNGGEKTQNAKLNQNKTNSLEEQSNNDRRPMTGQTRIQHNKINKTIHSVVRTKAPHLALSRPF